MHATSPFPFGTYMKVTAIADLVFTRPVTAACPLPIAAARPRTRGTSPGSRRRLCRQRRSDKVHGNKESRRAASRRAAVAPRPSAAV